MIDREQHILGIDPEKAHFKSDADKEAFIRKQKRILERQFKIEQLKTRKKEIFKRLIETIVSKDF